MKATLSALMGRHWTVYGQVGPNAWNAVNGTSLAHLGNPIGNRWFRWYDGSAMMSEKDAARVLQQLRTVDPSCVARIGRFDWNVGGLMVSRPGR